MNARMECTRCGSLYHSSAWEQMLADGERCPCGGGLRKAEARGTPPPAAASDAHLDNGVHPAGPVAGIAPAVQPG